MPDDNTDKNLFYGTKYLFKAEKRSSREDKIKNKI